MDSKMYWDNLYRKRMVNKEDNTGEKYNGWIVSNSFWKRAFAVLGYGTLAYTMILLFFGVLIMLLI